MRPIPEPPPATLNTERVQAHELKVEVCLITRLYGGGARAGAIDERSWIRPPAFKSALRFWWRAGHAHLFENLADLHREESRLFGSPGRFRGDEIDGGPGLVQVRVEGAVSANVDLKAYQPEQGDPLNVAYFPAALTRDGEEQKLGMPEQGAKRVRAHLVMAFDPSATAADVGQIQTALRLFLVLGGIGARSRRGAGALGLVREETAKELGVPTSRAELSAFFNRFLRPDHPGEARVGLWSLAHCKAVWLGRKETSSGEEAQQQLLATLREARQDRPHPGNWQGKAGWGQSRWPEGDAIRWKTQKSSPPAASWRHKPHPKNQGCFPRAALGLPIIVHFKDQRHGEDPPDHSVSAAIPAAQPGGKPTRINRFASPLILRPVRIWVAGAPRHIPVAVLGPMTLRPDAVPAVELTKNNVVPETPAPQDLIPTYSIAAHADLAFSKVIEKFSSFHRLV